MLDYRDILNKYYVIKLSVREISRQTGMSKSGVQKFIHAFEKCEDLDFPLPPVFCKHVLQKRGQFCLTINTPSGCKQATVPYRSRTSHRLSRWS